MSLEKLVKSLSGNTYVYIVVDLNRHTDPITLSDTEAAGQHHIILQPVLGHGALQHLYNIL